MLVVQIAAGVALGVWLEKWARYAAEERWQAAQGRISRREASLHPMVTEVCKWFGRESSTYHGYGEWPVPAAPLQHIIANEMQRRRTEMPGVYVPGTWKTTDMMERAAKYVAEDCPLRVLADPRATLSANDLHRQEDHGSNPLSSTRKSAQTGVTSQGQK
jgi:hypothetical protein